MKSPTFKYIQMKKDIAALEAALKNEIILAELFLTSSPENQFLLLGLEWRKIALHTFYSFLGEYLRKDSSDAKEQ